MYDPIVTRNGCIVSAVMQGAWLVRRDSIDERWHFERHLLDEGPQQADIFFGPDGPEPDVFTWRALPEFLCDCPYCEPRARDEIKARLGPADVIFEGLATESPTDLGLITRLLRKGEAWFLPTKQMPSEFDADDLAIPPLSEAFDAGEPVVFEHPEFGLITLSKGRRALEGATGGVEVCRVCFDEPEADTLRGTEWAHLCAECHNAMRSYGVAARNEALGERLNRLGYFNQAADIVMRPADAERPTALWLSFDRETGQTIEQLRPWDVAYVLHGDVGLWAPIEPED